MKKLGFLVVILLNVLYIYKITKDDKVYFLALGDYMALGVTDTNHINGGYNEYIKDYLNDINKLELYNNEFAVNNFRTTDLINDINNNKDVSIDGKNITIQNALIKTDLTTLSIGNNDLMFELQNSVSMDSVDIILGDIDNLFKLVRKYTKETVIVNSFYYYKESDIVNYANERLEILCDKYDFIYNNINSILNDKISSMYPSQSSYKKIADNILNKIVIEYVNKEF